MPLVAQYVVLVSIISLGVIFVLWYHRQIPNDFADVPTELADTTPSNQGQKEIKPKMNLDEAYAVLKAKYDVSKAGDKKSRQRIKATRRNIDNFYKQKDLKSLLALLK